MSCLSFQAGSNSWSGGQPADGPSPPGALRDKVALFFGATNGTRKGPILKAVLDPTDFKMPPCQTTLTSQMRKVGLRVGKAPAQGQATRCWARPHQTRQPWPCPQDRWDQHLLLTCHTLLPCSGAGGWAQGWPWDPTGPCPGITKEPFPQCRSLTFKISW